MENVQSMREFCLSFKGYWLTHLLHDGFHSLWQYLPNTVMQQSPIMMKTEEGEHGNTKTRTFLEETIKKKKSWDSAEGSCL